jgi:hypothetical protein
MSNYKELSDAGLVGLLNEIDDEGHHLLRICLMDKITSFYC